MSRQPRIHKHPIIKTIAADRLLSLSIIVLLICMALPSVVKFNHAIHDHEERQCNSDTRTHFHASEFDCVFHKFKVATSFYPPLFVFDAYIPGAYLPYILPGYTYFKSCRLLPFGLRAPPHYS